MAIPRFVKMVDRRLVGLGSLSPAQPLGSRAFPAAPFELSKHALPGFIINTSDSHVFPPPNTDAQPRLRARLGARCTAPRARYIRSKSPFRPPPGIVACLKCVTAW